MNKLMGTILKTCQKFLFCKIIVGDTLTFKTYDDHYIVALDAAKFHGILEENIKVS